MAYKMKGHSLPGINQRKSPAKDLSGIKINWKGLGKMAGPMSTQVGMPILMMKGVRMQIQGMGGDIEAKPKEGKKLGLYS